MMTGARWGMRLLWFLSLWLAGVGVTAGVAFGIRLWLSPG